MERTQIYLDADQKAALRALAADRGQNVSDIIRQAIDRMIVSDLAKVDLNARLAAVQSRLRERIGDVTEEQIDVAAERARAGVRAERSVPA